MTRFELVIVGGGLAAARAIKGYRTAGGRGRIALIAAEETLPYHRPPLSKRFLRGEAELNQTLVEPEQFYAASDVDVVPATEVTRVDPREQAVVTDRAARYRYGKLLLATGAVPRTLDVEGADLPGVFSLRSIHDAGAIRERAAQARDAVVVGSGFIGMEAAASLTQLGLDVTLVSRDVDLFAQLRSPEISDHLVNLYRDRGVDVIRGYAVRAFRGISRLDTVELHSGQAFGSSLAVTGVGVRPAASFVRGSGIGTDDGIVVDERFRTNIENIYAVGDVARFFDPLYDRHRRIEHWSNADYQGSLVGRILAGSAERYDTVSTFFTESFGLTLKAFGDLTRHDDRITRGSFADGDAITFYFERGRLVGTLQTGQDDPTEQSLKRFIRERARPGKIELIDDESVPLEVAFAPDAHRVAA